LDPALLLAVEYQDEEQDWVTLSSDEELKLATSFCGSPLRLRIRIVGKQSTVPSFQTAPLPAQRMSVEESNTVAAPLKETRRKQQALTKQERMTAKSERLSERISIIETRLKDPNLKSDRERVLLWKVEKLRETWKETQEAIANFPAQSEEETNSASEDSEPEITSPSDFPRPRGRRCGPGRGDRPNARFAVRRGPWNKFAAEQDDSVDQEPERKRSFDTKFQETPQDKPNDFRFALSEVKRCRADLKAARASREEEAIKCCEMAFKKRWTERENLPALGEPRDLRGRRANSDNLRGSNSVQLQPLHQ